MITKEETKVFILAAGRATRWSGNRTKQLIDLGKETIIERTQRMCFERGYNPIVVTWNEEIKPYCKEVFVPEKYTHTCTTVLSTQSLWNLRNIILLGDVIYSINTLEKILNDDATIRFYGNDAEIFALQFKLEAKDRIIKSFDKAQHYALGKLRYAYQHITGVPFDRNVIDKEVMMWISDWTNDIDCPHDWNRFKIEVINRNRLLG